MVKRIASVLIIFLFSGGIIQAADLPQNPPQTPPASNTPPPKSATPKELKAAAALSKPFSERKQVQRFIRVMNAKHKLSSRDLSKLFKGITSDPAVIAAISKPFEDVPWPQYRSRLVSEERAQKGAAFLKKYEEILKQAETRFGVPAEIIVAILGVESRYGENMGSFSVLRTLATLAFDYEPRAKFFKGELEQFLVLSKEEGLETANIQGSYAGAIGAAQFMPSSYRQYAVDFSGTGKRDLISNMSDAIGSIGNYLKVHGWKANQPVALAATALGSEYQRLANTSQSNPVPKLSLGQFAQFNILPRDKKLLKDKSQDAAAFVILKGEKEPEHWLTLNNFYVITRYNHNVNYAMAIFQLAERIRAIYPKKG